LDSVLRSVPYIASLGIAVQKSTAEEVTLTLPETPFVVGHRGQLHSSVLITLGELAATLLLKGHPSLQKHQILLKSTKISYRRPPVGTITATARTDDNAVSSATAHVTGDKAVVSQTAEIFNARGETLADVESTFTLRLRKSSIG